MKSENAAERSEASLYYSEYFRMPQNVSDHARMSENGSEP